MLPTEKAKNVFLIKGNNTGSLEKVSQTLSYNEKWQNPFYTPQHLYILSGEEIKKGEYITDYNVIVKYIDSGIVDPNKSLVKYKKVIATTDKSLGLPLIHDSFLPPFIKAYNEGKQITEVDLETRSVIRVESAKQYDFDEIIVDGEFFQFIHMDSKFDLNSISFIKTRQDNTVIIHESKKYSKQEVINLCQRANTIGIKSERFKTDINEDFLKFVDENI